MHPEVVIWLSGLAVGTVIGAALTYALLHLAAILAYLADDRKP